MTNEQNESRRGLISAISTPIQFAALIVLVVEGLLAYLLSKAATDDIFIYVTMMVVVLLLTITAAFIIEFKRIKLSEGHMIPATGDPEKLKNYTWDVFLAAPMAALTDEDFERDLQKIKAIKTALEERCNFKRVFFAGTNMKTKSDFDTADISIGLDLDALKESEKFIMIYPDKIVSSVLVEAGIALALGKQSFFFGMTENFPFLLQQANQQFDHIKIYNSHSLDDILSIILKNANNLFARRTKSKP